MDEKSPKPSEALNQQILDALEEGILVVDEHGIILNLNQSLIKYLDQEKIKGVDLGSSIYDMLRDQQEYKHLEKSLASILEKKSSVFEHQLSLKDGKWYNIKINPLTQTRGAVISFRNINTRKEIEIALESSLKKYRNIYNKAPVMMHSVDREGKIISVSDFWLEKMGYDRNEIIGKSPKVFIHRSYHNILDENLRTLFEQGEIKNVNYKFRQRSGAYIDVVLGAVAEYDDNGDFERSIAGMIDVTDQKKIEKDLHESRARLLESQKISKIGHYELDIRTGKFQSSSELDLIMGLGSKDRDLSVSKDLIHPDDYNGFIQKLEQCIEKKGNFFHIYRIYHIQTKKLKWVSGRGKMIVNKRGEVTKMIGTVQDITEQRLAEDKIKKLSDRILLSSEIANLGIWEYDADQDEVFWEDQMYLIFSGASKPYRLNELREVIDEEKADFLNDHLRLIKNGINFIETEVKVNIAGQTKFLRTFTRVMRTENNYMKGLIGVVYDITEDKKLQTQLQESLDEKNILIREVHHRVKNNMQLISSIMALKAFDLKDDEARIIFEDINTRIKAMSVIYDRLHKFYNVAEIDIHNFLTHVSKELGILLGLRSIQLKIDVIKEEVSIDQALVLGLIVSELVSNAIKHSFSTNEKGAVHIQLDRIDQDKLFLSVTNDGKKIPDNIIHESKGIGMSMIKTFVRQIKGQLSLDNQNGFRVEFSG